MAELAVAVEILSSAKLGGLLITKPIFVVGADITEFKSMFAAGKEQFVKAVAMFSNDVKDLGFAFPSGNKWLCAGRWAGDLFSM